MVVLAAVVVVACSAFSVEYYNMKYNVHMSQATEAGFWLYGTCAITV